MAEIQVPMSVFVMFVIMAVSILAFGFATMGMRARYKREIRALEFKLASSAEQIASSDAILEGAKSRMADKNERIQQLELIIANQTSEINRFHQRSAVRDAAGRFVSKSTKEA